LREFKAMWGQGCCQPARRESRCSSLYWASGGGQAAGLLEWLTVAVSEPWGRRRPAGGRWGFCGSPVRT
ncbi:hypothetical protein M9458_046082, partial [Cirrhinus mrigala]